MLLIIIFFILGVVLGAIGLRLLAHWSEAQQGKPNLGHWHRRP